jgi:hypothetical protein
MQFNVAIVHARNNKRKEMRKLKMTIGSDKGERKKS